jgi:hypothetical protein
MWGWAIILYPRNFAPIPTTTTYHVHAQHGTAAGYQQRSGVSYAVLPALGV